MWQTAEIFHVAGLKEPQYLVPREDFGSVKRTLDAYLAAHSCKPVEWEINWKTKYPPEFRLRPAKNGARYSPLQLLAVLRALRYNDYFNSLSFRDVDLTVLQDICDIHASSRGHVAYLSRTCMFGPSLVFRSCFTDIWMNRLHPRSKRSRDTTAELSITPRDPRIGLLFRNYPADRFHQLRSAPSTQPRRNYRFVP